MCVTVGFLNVVLSFSEFELQIYNLSYNNLYLEKNWSGRLFTSYTIFFFIPLSTHGFNSCEVLKVSFMVESDLDSSQVARVQALAEESLCCVLAQGTSL